jgi:UDP-N-acetylglucosamine 2-epimerase (non-hydrolysing)
MTRRLRIVVIGGTRPEAIKLAPVIRALRDRELMFETTTVSTGQHHLMFREVLATFGVQPDIELNTPSSENDLNRAFAATLLAVGDILRQRSADCVVVQGDTTSAFAGALSAFYQMVPVAHVEAGLRSGDRYSPYPEETNTQLITRLAELHFAPTTRARGNLIAEGMAPNRIVVTGNTVVDALEFTKNRLTNQSEPTQQNDGARMILASAHRREHFGEPLVRICSALREVVDRNPDTHLCYSLHPNPRASQPATQLLSGHPRITLIPPLPYPDFVRLMRDSYFIVTDSSGMQEEAPSLSKPLLVLRDITERGEGIEAGVARLVGATEASIKDGVQQLLDDDGLYCRMASGRTPYGDGHAGDRIAESIAENLYSRANVNSRLAAIAMSNPD